MTTISRSLCHWRGTTSLYAIALTFFTSAVALAQPHTFDLEWGSQGSGDGEFMGPFGVAVDASSNVYVADLFNHRVQKFDSSGSFLTKCEKVIVKEISRPIAPREKSYC